MNKWLIGKVPDAGKDRGQKEKRASENEMARQHHWCNEHELVWTPGNGEGQEDLECCSLRGYKEPLNTTNNNKYSYGWCTLLKGRNLHNTVRQLKVKVKSPQSCLTLCDLMDCSLPGSPFHGILQARILE